jgi:ATP-dependent Clp protease ATP-binding subunit ClpA
MVERLSEQAARALHLAHVEARSFGHGRVGTEHLLLGILAEGDNPAAEALLESGATLYGCREMAAEAVGATGGSAGGSGELDYSERASRALERASRLALRRRQPAVETTHVLASVLDVEGRAGQVLRGLGVDPARVHQALDASVVPAAAPGGTAEGEVTAVTAVTAVADVGGTAPVCANCGASLESHLGEREVSVRRHGAPAGAWMVAYCTSCGSAVGARAVERG